MNVNSTSSSSSSPSTESPIGSAIFSEDMLTSLHSLDELSTNFDKAFDELMAKIANLGEVLLKSQNTSTRVAAFMIDHLEAGTLTFVSGLEQDGIVIPSHPQSNLIDEIQLKKEISKAGDIAQRGRKAMQPGCSVLFTLLIDDVLQAFDNLMADPKARKHLGQQMNIKSLQGNWYFASIRDLAREHLVNILSNLGTVAGLAQRGSGWHCALGVQSTLTPAAVQKQMIDQAALLEQHIQIINIQQFASGKAYLQACKLLDKVMLSRPNDLFQPLLPNPDLSLHHERLLHRVCRMATFVEEFNNQKNTLKKTQTDPTYTAELDKALAMMQRFAKEAETVLKVRKDNHADFDRIYHFVESWAGKTDDPDGEFGLLARLSVDLQNPTIDPLKRDMQEDTALITVRKLNVLNWMFISVIDEMALCSLTELMNRDKVGADEVKAAIESLKDVVRAIQGASRHEIEGYLNQEETEPSMLLIQLRSIWKNDFLVLSDHMLAALYRTLELRLERLEQTENPILESALAMREVLMVFGGGVQRIVDRIKSDLERQRMVVETLSDEDPLRRVFNAMNELLLLNQETLRAVISRVESVITNGIEEIHNAELEERAVAVANGSPKGKGANKKAQDEEINRILLEIGKSTKAKRNKGASSKKKGSKTKGKGSVAKPNQKGSQSLLSPPTVDIVQKAVVQEVVQPLPQPEAIVTDLAPSILNVPKISVSLTALDNNLRRLCDAHPIAGHDSKFRTEWRGAQVQNALTLIKQIYEYASYPRGTNAIIGFDQVDLSRKLAEAVLEIILASYPVGSDTKSCLREAGFAGHRLHLWTRTLLNADDVVPSELRLTTWQLREVPYLLSDANACVNYPHRTAATRERLHPRSRQLLDFLLKTEQCSLLSKGDDDYLASITHIRNQIAARSVFFAERLITVMLCPDEADMTNVANANEIKQLLAAELPALQPTAQRHEKEVDTLARSVPAAEAAAVKIQDRRDALNAIDTALRWISVRLTAPVQGLQDRPMRTKKRDQALRNVASYLRRLREHLDHHRFKRPHLTLLSQLELSRRAHKELHIAALYQTAGGSHVADEELFTNNPLFIAQRLGEILGQRAKLPRLGRWLGSAHQVASYPVSLMKNKKQGFEERTLRELVTKVRELADKRAEMNDGFTVVGGGRVPHSNEKSEGPSLKELLKSNEKERTFPAIASLLELLHNGFQYT